MFKFFAIIFTAVFAFAKPIVTTSVLPTKYFIERIAGDTLSVNVMVGAGADAHTYEPKPKQMLALEKSQMYFAIGIEFEDVWLAKFSQTYPNLAIINTDKGIKKLKYDEHDHDHNHAGDIHHDHGEHAHHHGHDHGHHHGEFDTHIWLDPILVKTQAQNIAQALISKFPQHSALYEANLATFLAELDALDRQIADILKSLDRREFLVYHPSWGYFAKRYNLEQLAIEIKGKEPKPAQLAEIIEEAKEHQIKAIFVAPNFSDKSAKTIASQTGANVISIEVLTEKWKENMLAMARAIAGIK